jgi:uncharacterized membrane protein YccC
VANLQHSWREILLEFILCIGILYFIENTLQYKFLFLIYPTLKFNFSTGINMLDLVAAVFVVLVVGSIIDLWLMFFCIAALRKE